MVTIAGKYGYELDEEIFFQEYPLRSIGLPTQLLVELCVQRFDDAAHLVSQYSHRVEAMNAERCIGEMHNAFCRVFGMLFDL